MIKVLDLTLSLMWQIFEVRDANRTADRRIGMSVLSAARREATASYERMCLLSLFTKWSDFDTDQTFEAMYEAGADGESKCELLLALGRARKTHWFLLAMLPSSKRPVRELRRSRGLENRKLASNLMFCVNSG